MDYITADLHFDHPGVIVHSKRPFIDIIEMQDKLIDEINSLPGNGCLILGGDTFVGKKTELIVSILERVLRPLKFVLGNHDKRLVDTYSQFGDVSWQLQLRMNKTKMVVTHFPQYEWDGGQHGSVHCHGHTHGEFVGQGKMIDVGWDCYKRILTVPEAFALADAKPIYQPCHNKNNGLHRSDL